MLGVVAGDILEDVEHGLVEENGVLVGVDVDGAQRVVQPRGEPFWVGRLMRRPVIVLVGAAGGAAG